MNGRKLFIDISSRTGNIIITMRKVFVKMTVNLIINADEGVDIGNVIDESLFIGLKTNVGADLEDVDILSHEIVDSK
jgi:hypothetical protein